VSSSALPLAAPVWPFEVYDVHIHVSPVWYQPVESILPEMERAGVHHGVLCQLHGEFNNEYQFAVAERFPGTFASIVHVDPAAPDAAEQLRAAAARGASGARIRPQMRSPGKDPLAIWRAAAAAGLSITSFGGSLAAFLTDDFARIVQTFPETPIVLEHQAGYYLETNGPASLEEVKAAFALARFPNTYVMIGGLGEFTPRLTPVTRPLPFARPLPPILELAYDAFGPQRMMWGSDFPPVSVREGYLNSLRWTVDALAAKSTDDLAWIFGRTGRQVFPIRP
jgi:L-fuconolactonase